MEEQVFEQANGSLAVVETKTAFFVVQEADNSDWLVRFEKAWDFDARSWAENMVRIYNRRLAQLSAGPPVPPGVQPANYDPNLES